APASSQTSSPPDVSGLAMEDALKVLLSSVNRASQELALLTQDEPGKKVTRDTSGPYGQGRGSEASSGSRPSASAAGTAAAVLTDGSSISSESRSGDAQGPYRPGPQARARGALASSADAASKPLETEGSSSISSSWEGTGPGKPESGRVMATRMLADALKSFSGDLRQ
ncbi:unnamed protein product, partial [Symbiodinium microadriaticum]